MMSYSVEDDSESKESDFSSLNGDDVDVYLNHYRIPKLMNHGPNGSNSSPRGRGSRDQIKCNNEGKIMSLTELAAQKVACHLPFGLVEHFDPPVPEPMQCRIAFWSFPQDEEDVRLYTCLANGNADVFVRAEDLISLNCVCDMLQVGFHLSANVKFVQDANEYSDSFRVAITFDRRRITSCSCSCSASTFWCQHVVAVCLQRIRKPQDVTLRAPVSESLQRLEKNQLQKFAQYLINELPQQILPAAQKLLDELLSGDDATINKNPAAPDPTAGATINEETSWCLEESHLSNDIQRILLKHCATQPTVCSDIQSLHSSAPPAASEYTQLLRPIRGREPEGLWNLISIVSEMMKRHDSNCHLLLEIVTAEVLKCQQVVTWWFETKVSLHFGSTVHFASTKGSSSQSTSQYSCSNFCDEIVHLWRLAALNPSSNEAERKRLYKKLLEWNLNILKSLSAITDSGQASTARPNRRNLPELFPGFKAAMEGCLINWSDWDDRRCMLVDHRENCDNDDTKEVKPSKSSRKKKRRSRSKHHQSNAAAQSGPSLEGSSRDHQPDDIVALTDDQNSKSSLKEETARSVSCPSEEQNAGFDERVGNASSDADRDELAVGFNHQQRQQHPIPEAPRRDLNDIEPELQVYFMDPPVENPSVEKLQQPEDVIKVNLRKLQDPLENLYAKTEGLYAHGYQEEAHKLAQRVALEILDHPSYPSLKLLCAIPRRRKKRGGLDNQMSVVTSEALGRISFLCNVLLDDPETHYLVFRLVLFGVEMRRSPAATKLLEVRLINQKQDLISLLKNITLHENELVILREKAQALRDEACESNPDTLTSLMLGKYIFEALVLSKSPSCSSCNIRPAIDTTRIGASISYNQSSQIGGLEEHYLQAPDIVQQPSSHTCDRQCGALIVYGKLPSDSSLGFHAALSALSSRAAISEADHPLLCEGIRRQRGDLAVLLLTYYKDEQEKLDLILKHLLDNDAILTHPAQNSTSVTLSTPIDESETNGKRSTAAQSELNQPTEASSHFMFELAKTVFEKAGGNNMTAHLFRPQVISQNSRGLHRKLHMCTLRLALYALGIQNRGSPNWAHRTYNGRAMFIHEQALEIGLSAIKFLCDNWEGYLTPVEVAAIADKAGTSSIDAETRSVAAEMAKSCLRHANYLDYNAVRRILAQCREQSINMTKEALTEIEQVAEKENVCADVLFATARFWYKLATDENQNGNVCCLRKDEQPLSDSSNNTSGWLATNETVHQPRFTNPHIVETVHPIQWNPYDRPEFLPVMYAANYQYMDYVKAAYRVGMRAMDSMKPSSNLGSKQNPKKEDDVLWLLALSKTLGVDHLRKFTQSAVENIINPHILHTISADLIKLFSTVPDDNPDRVSILLPVIDKCLDRFVRHTRDLMKHISWDQRNFIDSFIDTAQQLTYTANTLTAASHFKDLLRIVDSKKSMKHRIYVDTHQRHLWVNDLLSTMKTCTCAKCRTGRDLSLIF